jgi:hypothetical protein
LADEIDPKLKVFELYLATAEKVSDRRAAANAWMLSVNSAIVALYGYLGAHKLSVPVPQKGVWLWAIPAAGAIVAVAWAVLLTSYRQLNRAKFAVLQEMEKDLPAQPFAKERELYTRDRRRSLSTIETAILSASLCSMSPSSPQPRCCMRSWRVRLATSDGQRAAGQPAHTHQADPRAISRLCPLSLQRGHAEETRPAHRPQPHQPNPDAPRGADCV